MTKSDAAKRRWQRAKLAKELASRLDDAVETLEALKPGSKARLRLAFDADKLRDQLREVSF